MATRSTTETGRTAVSPQPSAPPPAKAASSRSTTPAKSTAGPAPAAAGMAVSADERRAMIAQAAYLRAERRGFAPGSEVEDWLAAEADIDALLEAGNIGPPQ